MASFPTAVNPPSNYGPPNIAQWLSSFLSNSIGDLPNDYYQGKFNAQNGQESDLVLQQQQQQAAIQQRVAQAFPNGLPIDPQTGQIDYRKVNAGLAGPGGVGGMPGGLPYVNQLAPFIEKQAGNATPAILGGEPQGGQSASSTTSAPPASSGLVKPTGYGTQNAKQSDKDSLTPGEGTQDDPYRPRTKAEFGQIPDGSYWQGPSGPVRMKGSGAANGAQSATTAPTFTVPQGPTLNAGSPADAVAQRFAPPAQPGQAPPSWMPQGPQAQPQAPVPPPPNPSGLPAATAAVLAPQPQQLQPQNRPPVTPMQANPVQPGGPAAQPRGTSVAPQPGQGGPIWPHPPMPPGFKPGQEQQAILALRNFADRTSTTPRQAADANARADALEKWIEPREVHAGQTLIDPASGRVIYQAPGRFGAGTPEMVHQIADGIRTGKQPPVLTGLYGMSGPIRADLEESGFDLAKAQLEYSRAQKQIIALNGPQMTRFVGLAGSVVNTIDEVKRLSEQMQLSGVPLANGQEIRAYIQARGNTPNGQLAARYVGAVNTLKEEFANLAQGGYAPTEPVWALANRQINENYGVQELGASLDEIQRLINYRIDAVPNLKTMGPGAANRYTGQPQAGPPEGQPQSGAAPAAAPGTVIQYDQNGNRVQ
jgi:hypothetical protein